jgi:ATP-dependent helicase HrpB
MLAVPGPDPLPFAAMTLPIEPAIPELRSALAASRGIVLQAPPGAGKTTRVPLALLDVPWLGDRKIIMLEPRRLAARAAAARMSATLGERVGETVGYRMRLDTRVGPRTRIEVVTEGILTRMLQHDLALDGVGLVIFDEFHERSLAGDTGLALTLAAADSLRDDLKILVMSATLDGLAVARLLGEAPVVRSEGRAWPVETRHQPSRGDQPQSTGYQRRSALEAHVARVVRDVVATEAGSVLVFLPGAGEIRRVEALLRGLLPGDVSLNPLHGSLPIETQDTAIALAPPGQRKVVLATSIAETSLTIEGIRVVVDSGLMRIPRFSPGTGMTRLETVRVSRASADQRRGRAGRIEPGVCVRCWSAGEDAGLVPYTRPEILDADLAPLTLDLASAGFTDPGELRWLDLPPAAAFAQARELLQLLGAVDDKGRITAHGSAMAELGTHPRLAHMLLWTSERGVDTPATAASLAAILEERDLLRGAGGPPPSDVQLRLDAVARDIDDVMLGGAMVDRGLVHRVRDVAAEWRRRMGSRLAAAPLARPDTFRPPGPIPRVAREDSVSPGILLALAYPDRVARRRDAPGRFLLRNGRGATLPLTDPLAQAEWIVAAQIDDAGRDGRITLAASLDPAELVAYAAEQVITRDEIAWNETTRSVQARRRTMLGALMLGDSAIPDVDPERISAALLDGIARIGVGALPWSGAATSLRQRLAFLRHHDRTWPDVSDEALGATLVVWLGPHVGGIRKLADLSRVDLGSVLRAMLTWEQRRQLDELAPERIQVPSRSRISVDYSDPAAPALAVRLQEVFGMNETPRLGGRVPVTMQLLSPAYRPVQVTRDLASFWKTGYFDVRKDLRGRYPKHHWPEDPLTAPAVHGAKRRR